MTQAALPLLREQGGGHILQVSSTLGVTTLPYLGLYNATKWAVEGLAQTLASEVAAFGIKTTLIEPGPYGTDWAGSARHTTPLPAYDQLRDAFSNSALVWVDPANTPRAIFAVVDAENPPLRVFLGTGPREMVTADYQARLDQWSAWADVATSAHSGPLPGLPIPA